MRFLFYILAFFYGAPLFAQEYPYLFRSAYFLGRGDTGIALAEGYEAIFYNPAGVAISDGILNEVIFVSPTFEISQDTRDVVKEVFVQDEDPTNTLRERLGEPQHFGVNNFTGVLLKRVALGVFVSQTASALVFRDPTLGASEGVDAGARLDGGLVFSLASWTWKRNLYFGFTGKYIVRSQGAFAANAAEANQVTELNSEKLAMTGTGFGGDFGVMYRGEAKRAPFSLGLTVQDIGGTSFSPTTKTELAKAERPIKDIKQTVNAGLALEPGTRASKFRVLADVRDLLDETKMDFAKKVHIGGELTVLNVVGFTFGLNQGYPTFGMFADLPFLRADLGFYSEELGEKAGHRPDTRYFFRLMVGL
ncbi:MAG: hypothetical protein HYW48_01400 [Deltaproteobacteria bacterium]|nr:hypothetical protein [Deltaproteobacteria bacterium]